MNKKPRFFGLAFYAFVIAGLMLFATYMGGTGLGKDTLEYSQILEQIEVGNVDKLVVNGTTLDINLKKPLEGQQSTKFSKAVSPYWMEKLLGDLEKAQKEQKIQFDYAEPVNYSGIFNGFGFLLLIIVFGVFIYFSFMRQNSEGKNQFNFGRSSARRYDNKDNGLSFKDVAGIEEEKLELSEIVDFLKNTEKYSRLGAKIPRGVLMVGSPGTGKTLLAKAVAGEAGVPFYSISGSDFVEMYVGVGASRVRDLFSEVKKNAPAIVFIDEIDAVGRQRGAGMGGGHDEREQTLNQILIEMDGFSDNLGVIVMAATNRPDILDSALLRPGRFDRKIMVPVPDMLGREEILKVHQKGKPLAADVDLKEVAQNTPGFTGADLANLLNEAALLCARRDGSEITYEDITEAVFKVTVGTEKRSRIMNAHERKLTAYHEAGHAIVLRSVSQTDKVERVSIIPAGSAGGYTAHKPSEDLYYYTQSMILASIQLALGGRAAEELIFNEVTTGASSDLSYCNKLARDMICKYGMSQSFQNMVFSSDDEVFLGRDYGHVKSYSDEVANAIDEEVRNIISSAYQNVLQILNDKRQLLEALTNRLLEVEKIDGDEFERLYQENTTEEQRKNDPKNPAVLAVLQRLYPERYPSDKEGSKEEVEAKALEEVVSEADIQQVLLAPDSEEI